MPISLSSRFTPRFAAPAATPMPMPIPRLPALPPPAADAAPGAPAPAPVPAPAPPPTSAPSVPNPSMSRVAPSAARSFEASPEAFSAPALLSSWSPKAMKYPASVSARPGTRVRNPPGSGGNRRGASIPHRLLSSGPTGAGRRRSGDGFRVSAVAMILARYPEAASDHEAKLDDRFQRFEVLIGG